jgi:hypothetical protein
MNLYPNGTPWQNSPGIDPSKFSVQTLNSIASFHRIVLNYLRMQRLLDEAAKEEAETKLRSENGDK